MSLKCACPLPSSPATSPLEIMVGAVLKQNAAWTNIDRALTNLRNAGVVLFEKLRE